MRSKFQTFFILILCLIPLAIAFMFVGIYFTVRESENYIFPLVLTIICMVFIKGTASSFKFERLVLSDYSIEIFYFPSLKKRVITYMEIERAEMQKRIEQKQDYHFLGRSVNKISKYTTAYRGVITLTTGSQLMLNEDKYSNVEDIITFVQDKIKPH